MLKAIFNAYGYTRNAHTNSTTVFSGRDVFSGFSESTTWSIFLRHLNVLASDRAQCLTIVDCFICMSFVGHSL